MPETDRRYRSELLRHLHNRKADWVRTAVRTGEIKIAIKEIAGVTTLWIYDPKSRSFRPLATVESASNYKPTTMDLAIGNSWKIVLRDRDAKDPIKIYTAIPAFLGDHYGVNKPVPISIYGKDDYSPGTQPLARLTLNGNLYQLEEKLPATSTHSGTLKPTG